MKAAKRLVWKPLPPQEMPLLGIPEAEYTEPPRILPEVGVSVAQRTEAEMLASLNWSRPGVPSDRFGYSAGGHLSWPDRGEQRLAA